MKASDKQRILSTDTVRGEILIESEYGSKFKYPFGDLFSKKRDGKQGCFMIDHRAKREYDCFGDAYLQPREKHLKIWKTGYGGQNFVLTIPYKNVEILWCIYDGISNARDEFENPGDYLQESLAHQHISTSAN